MQHKWKFKRNAQEIKDTQEDTRREDKKPRSSHRELPGAARPLYLQQMGCLPFEEDKENQNKNQSRRQNLK